MECVLVRGAILQVSYVFALPPGSHPIRHRIQQLRSIFVIEIHRIGSIRRLGLYVLSVLVSIHCCDS